MDYSKETEADTRANRIDPKLAAAGWTSNHIRREVICPGRIQTGGKRGKALSCDYVLLYKGQKLAAIEAKRAGLSYREGTAQAKNYADKLGCRFAFSTNGLTWYMIDMLTGQEGEIELPFPSPEELWNKTFDKPNPWRDRFGEVPFESAGGKWQPRYYSHRAIASALGAIADGKDRILLTMATGTGKTAIAFHIAWKLFQSKWNLSRQPSRRPRILFLADRNILADQAYNAFSAFPSDAIVRIDPATIGKKGGVPKNASLFFTIFQTLMTEDGEKRFKEYSEDFFDFIIVDECHRGGANDESTWRAILEHFSPAVQLGLTATPKRSQNVDTYEYFGEPVYTYSLKDGINDGFLTPFKVRQIASTMDDFVFEEIDTLVQGDLKPGTVIPQAQLNRNVIVEERERSRVREMLSEINPREKTLVFCATQAHAALVRDFINKEPVSNDPNYCHRVTADDGKDGEQHLRDFQDNDKTIPTILTTSQKLSTGVDALNIRNIVLMRPVTSMIEFKQIIGRGTRTFEGKDYFTVYDFVGAYKLFQDPEWDGPPEAPDGPGDPRVPIPPVDSPASPGEPPEGPEEPPEPAEKIIIKLGPGRERAIQYIKTTSYWDEDGKPISAQEFLERLFGKLEGLIGSEDKLREVWSDPDTRERFLVQLDERGYGSEQLEQVQELVDAVNSDLFDVLAYILFGFPAKTRDQRASKIDVFKLADGDEEVSKFLQSILKSYVDEGETQLSSAKLEDHMKARYHSVGEGKEVLGGVTRTRRTYRGFQQELYQG